MIEMVIWLVVIAAFVFRALKKNGTLDELFAGAKKRKENKAERVVYEQPEEGSGKKEKKKGPGIRVPKHTGLAVTAVVIVLAAAVLSLRQLLYSFRGGDGGGHHVRKTGSGGGIRSSL